MGEDGLLAVNSKGGFQLLKVFIIVGIVAVLALVGVWYFSYQKSSADNLAAASGTGNFNITGKVYYQNYPLTGVNVAARVAGTTQEVASAGTGAGNSYTLSVPKGTYDIVAFNLGYDVFTQTNYQVTKSGNNLNIYLIPTATSGSLKGTIKYSDGSPVLGYVTAFCRTTWCDFGLATSNKTTGIYNFYALPPGEYSVTVNTVRWPGEQISKNNRTAQGYVTITTGQAATLDLVIQK